jgi:hypothetical protein
MMISISKEIKQNKNYHIVMIINMIIQLSLTTILTLLFFGRYASRNGGGAKNLDTLQGSAASKSSASHI